MSWFCVSVTPARSPPSPRWQTGVSLWAAPGFCRAAGPNDWSWEDRQTDRRLALTKNCHVYWYITEVLFRWWLSKGAKSSLSEFELRRKILQYRLTIWNTFSPHWLLYWTFRHNGNSPCVASWKPSFLPHLVNAELLGTVTSWVGENKRWVIALSENTNICATAIPSKRQPSLYLWARWSLPPAADRFLSQTEAGGFFFRCPFL